MLSFRNTLRNTLNLRFTDRNIVRAHFLWRRFGIKRRNKVRSSAFSIKIAPQLCSTDVRRTMKTALAALAAVLTLGYGLVLACSDDEHHQQTRFQAPPTALTPPSRPLVWGEVNIIHTTDTHGWLLGHQKSSPPEPNYRFVLSPQQSSNSDLSFSFSGTFGDFASFVFHMNETAKVCKLERT